MLEHAIRNVDQTPISIRTFDQWDRELFSGNVFGGYLYALASLTGIATWWTEYGLLLNRCPKTMLVAIYRMPLIGSNWLMISNVRAICSASFSMNAWPATGSSCKADTDFSASINRCSAALMPRQEIVLG